MNYQFQYVLLYISGTLDHIIEILIMIFTGIFLFLKKKMQHCKYQNYFVFYWPSLTAFLIIICVSSSSINAKKKFWSVPILFHTCGIFSEKIHDSLTALDQMVFIMENTCTLPPSCRLSCTRYRQMRVLVLNFWGETKNCYS